MDLKDKMIIRNNSIETAEMGEEVGMIDVETGNYYMLNEVGKDIWTILEQKMTFEQLIDELSLLYDVDREICRVESLGFIDDMIENMLIQISDS